MADQSSHDLFDYKFLKDHEPDWPKIVAKLNSLAIGYKKIREAKGDLQKILIVIRKNSIRGFLIDSMTRKLNYLFMNMQDL